MAELRTSLVVDLAGDLERRGDAFARSFARIGTSARTGFRLAESSAAGLGDKLSWLGSKWMLISGGLGAAALIHATLTIEQRLERLGVQANATSQQVKDLWDQVNARSGPVFEIRADPTQVLGAIEQIVERTGDLKFVRDNLLNIAQAIQATGAGGPAIGGLMSEFQKMGLSTKDVAAALDLFHEKGKAGAFTLQNVAALGPRLMAAYTATGRTGLSAVNEIASSIQVIRRGTGTSDEAATAYEAILRTFGDRAKVQQLAEHGIQVFDPEQLAKGRQVMRPLPDLMAEIVEKAQGRMTNLSTIFDAEAMRGFNSINAEYLKTGNVESLAQFMAIRGRGGTAEDAARMAATTEAKLDKNKAEVLAAAEKYLDPVLEHAYGAAAAANKGKGGEFADESKEFFRSSLPAWIPQPDTPEEALQKSLRRQRLRESMPQRLSEQMGSFDAAQTRLAERLAREGAPGAAPEAPQGKVTIEVKAAPGTSARVVGKPEAAGMDLDVDSGRIMTGN